MRKRLAAWFRAALRELDVTPALHAALQARFGSMPAPQLLVVAFGKAARPMAAALRAALPTAHLRGLVVPPAPDDAPLPPFEVVAGGHPLPTADSMRAAGRALALCASAAPDEHVVFLVSGGGSALLETPIDPTVTLAELRALHAALVGCGADIRTMNVIRRRLSAVKGGRLAAAARAAKGRSTFAISDVPDGDLAALASGPTVPDPTPDAAFAAALARCGLGTAMPPALRARIDRGDLPPPLRPSDPAAAGLQAEILLDNTTARAALRAQAEACGVLVVEDPTVDDRPYDEAAERLLGRLAAERTAHPDRTVAVLTGGELSVPLPPVPGTGGRNQQFALACALRIQGQPIAVLSAGTDGIDGNSHAAGAVADGSTIARARTHGLDAMDHLRRCDAHPLFATLGDTVVTGPTGQNVRDLRLLIAAP